MTTKTFMITSLKELSFVANQKQGETFQAEVSIPVLNYLIGNEWYNVVVEKVYGYTNMVLVQIREVE